jgi:hypothetical protein
MPLVGGNMPRLHSKPASADAALSAFVASRHSMQAEVDPAMFLPPPLREGAVGWYPEWGKVRAQCCESVYAALRQIKVPL